MDYDKCTGCGECALVCPQKLITDIKATKAEA
ncbi:MAG: 4Fe-4S binding protein [Bacillota bacterium]|nr:4Fe-4S binding protein [Bacillota bacterium]